MPQRACVCACERGGDREQTKEKEMYAHSSMRQQPTGAWKCVHGCAHGQTVNSEIIMLSRSALPDWHEQRQPLQEAHKAPQAHRHSAPAQSRPQAQPDMMCQWHQHVWLGSR